MKIIIYVNLLCILFFSCEKDKFLDRPPLDNITTDEYWKSAKDLESYVSKFYQSFPSHGTWYNGYGYSVTNEVNLILSTPSILLNGQRGITGGRWVSDWANIRSINIFFDNYQKVRTALKTYTQYLGEAYFFRAYFYFNLLQKYGDLPWYSTELSVNSEKLMISRDSRTLVVDSILNDLDKATLYLNTLSKVGNNHLSKESALAFKSRVGLFEGTWQKYHANTSFGTSGADPNKYFRACIEASEELITGNYTRGLFNSYYELFGMANMSNIDEVFLYRAYNIADGVRNDVQYNTSDNPCYRGITWNLISSYLDRNGNMYDYLTTATTYKGNKFLTKIATDIDPRLHATIYSPGDLMWAETGKKFDKPSINGLETTLNPTGFQLKKASNPFAAGKVGGGSSETGYIIFRYGEVLLNYAEAKYEMDGIVTFDELNLLRKRAGMADFKILPQTSDPNLVDYGYQVTDALYEIRRERTVELALEGFGESDWKRWAAHNLFKSKRPKGYPFEKSEFPELNPLLDSNGLIDYFQKSMPNGYQFREDRDYLDPIPEEELTLNSNLMQNPGW